MSSKSPVWKATPSIIVEDVDRIQSKLDYNKYPDKNVKTQLPAKEKPSLSLETCKPLLPGQAVMLGTMKMIEPDVDAYVTPLSLCHPPSPREPACNLGMKIPSNVVTPVSKVKVIKKFNMNKFDLNCR